MSASSAGPFSSVVVDEVPLRSAPLTRVLAQVQFPPLSVLSADDQAINAYASALRSSYPVMTPQYESLVLIGPGGIQEQPAMSRTWQLRSPDEAWTVHVGPSFLSLNTGVYPSRAEFLDRWDRAWTGFRQVVDPPATTRIGIRYINQVTDEAFLDELPALVRPEVLGMLDIPLDGAELLHGLGQAQYRIHGDRYLTVRSGVVPPGLVLDPSTPPQDRRSWVLDLDAFEENRGDADASRVRDVLAGSAATAHAFFRWSTTERFIEVFGGRTR